MTIFCQTCSITQHDVVETLYVSTLALSTAYALIRRATPWRIRLALISWLVSAVVLVFTMRSSSHEALLKDLWMWVEMASLCVASVCLIKQFFEETKHPVAHLRFWLRCGAIGVPLVLVAWTWYFNRYTSDYWVFVAIRQRLWQYHLISWLIAFLNRWGKSRFSVDGTLFFRIAVLNGIIGSFDPSEALSLTFRASFASACLFWLVGQQRKDSVHLT
jgi:hypothetical protein